MSDLAVQYSTFTAEAVRTFVAEHYDLGPVTKCELFRQTLNDLYLLEADGKYVFRVWRRGLETPQLEARLSYAAQISKRHSVLARVYFGSNGNFVQTLNAPEGKRSAVLFDYLPGQSGTRQLSEMQAEPNGQSCTQLRIATLVTFRVWTLTLCSSSLSNEFSAPAVSALASKTGCRNKPPSYVRS